jgi:hypothetical protein
MLAMTAISLACTLMIRPSDMVGLPHGPAWGYPAPAAAR